MSMLFVAPIQQLFGHRSMPEKQAYLHIHCGAFSLLLASQYVDSIVAISEKEVSEKKLVWQGKELLLIDLFPLLISSNTKASSSEALIINYMMHEKSLCFALLAGQASAVEDIDESVFSSFPQLAFSVSHYFNKAYVEPLSQRFSYRLNILSLTRLALERGC